MALTWTRIGSILEGLVRSLAPLGCMSHLQNVGAFGTVSEAL